MFSPESLSAEFTRIYSRRGRYAKGTKGRIERYFIEQEKRILSLAGSIDSNTYRPSFKGCLIEQTRPNGTKKHRGITPLKIDEWIVELLLLRAMANHLLPEVSPFAYGRASRHGESSKSAAACCQDVKSARAEYPYVLKLDIENFYPTVDREALWRKVKDLLPTEWPFFELAERHLFTDADPPSNASSEQRQKFWPNGKGLRQGSVLSPLLACIALGDLDAKVGQDRAYFRYVDDIVILGSSPNELEERLLRFKDYAPAWLVLHPDKEEYCSPMDSFDFLGLQIQPARLAITKSSHDKFSNKVTSILQANDRPRQVLNRLHSYFDGWSQYYSYAKVSNTEIARARNLCNQEFRAFLENKLKIQRPAAAAFTKNFLQIDSISRGELGKAVNEAMNEGIVHYSEVDDLL